MSRTLPAMLALLAGLAIGAGAGRLFLSDAPARELLANREPQAAPDERAGAALTELAAEIRALRQSLDLREVATSRTSASGEDPRITQLLADFHALAGRVAGGSDTVEGPSRRADLLSRIGATGKPSFAEIDSLSDDSMESLGRVSEEWTTTHMLWTIPEIVERYGVPKNLWATSERTVLQYHRQRADGGRVLVEFTVLDGIVTRVEVKR